MILILGRMGTGKSWHGRALLAARPKRLILDPRAEHGGTPGAPEPGYLVADCLRDLLAIFQTGKPLDKITLVVRDVQDAGGYSLWLFELITRLRGYTVFIDEVDQYCSPHGLDENFRRLINYQRHFGVDIIAAARRAASIHRDLTALAAELHIFQTSEPLDLQYIAACCGKDAAEIVSKLRPRQYLQWSPNNPQKVVDTAAS